MARVKKFDVLHIPVEVEYEKPILGWFFCVLAWLIIIRVKKFNLTMNDKTVCSFYRLIFPRFVKGGEAGEK